MNTPNTYLKSAVVGMWRQGAEAIQIAVVTGLYEREVKEIIKKYKNANTSNPIRRQRTPVQRKTNHRKGRDVKV